MSITTEIVQVCLRPCLHCIILLSLQMVEDRLVLALDASLPHNSPTGVSSLLKHYLLFFQLSETQVQEGNLP